MSKRTELTLFLIVGLAVIAAGLLVWGQLSGRLQIFGDAAISTDEPLVVPLNSSTDTQTTTITESFDSLRYLDAAATTADWDHEAGELALLPGERDGLGQSLTVASLTGPVVQVELSVNEDRPPGSQIYYLVSADGGTQWQPVLPGQVVSFDNPAADWRWRALLKRGTAVHNPAVHDVTLVFRAND